MKPSDQRIEVVGDRDLANAAQLLQNHSFFVCRKTDVITVQASEQVSNDDLEWFRGMRPDFEISLITRVYGKLLDHLLHQQLANIRHEEDFGRRTHIYTARLNLFRPPSEAPIVRVPVMPLLPWERPSE